MKHKIISSDPKEIKVRVHGYDADGNKISEEVTVPPTGIVTTKQEFRGMPHKAETTNPEKTGA